MTNSRFAVFLILLTIICINIILPSRVAYAECKQIVPNDTIQYNICLDLVNPINEKIVDGEPLIDFKVNFSLRTTPANQELNRLEAIKLELKGVSLLDRCQWAVAQPNVSNPNNFKDGQNTEITFTNCRWYDVTEQDVPVELQFRTAIVDYDLATPQPVLLTIPFTPKFDNATPDSGRVGINPSLQNSCSGQYTHIIRIEGNPWNLGGAANPSYQFRFGESKETANTTNVRCERYTGSSDEYFEYSSETFENVRCNLTPLMNKLSWTDIENNKQTYEPKQYVFLYGYENAERDYVALRGNSLHPAQFVNPSSAGRPDSITTKIYRFNVRNSTSEAENYTVRVTYGSATITCSKTLGGCQTDNITGCNLSKVPFPESAGRFVTAKAELLNSANKVVDVGSVIIEKNEDVDNRCTCSPPATTCPVPTNQLIHNCYLGTSPVVNQCVPLSSGSAAATCTCSCQGTIEEIDDYVPRWLYPGIEFNPGDTQIDELYDLFSLIHNLLIAVGVVISIFLVPYGFVLVGTGQPDNIKKGWDIVKSVFAGLAILILSGSIIRLIMNQFFTFT